MLLQVKNLRVFYGKLEALKNISLSVEDGIIMTLIGPNGAGKSTLMKTISGLLKASSGEIWFRDTRIDADSPQSIVRRGIAQVPEGRRVFRDLSVLENFKMGAYLRNDPEINKDIDRICEYFPVLANRRHQQAGTLSGGEQQMLAMARALMSKPKLLLLDEPSLGLSPIITVQIAKIIRNINVQDKVSIMLVEQNAQLALRLAEKAYVLETGSIVLEGKSEDLRESSYIKEVYLGI
jgi:branched-chain amino acid transport system ATP-binding protein